MAEGAVGSAAVSGGARGAVSRARDSALVGFLARLLRLLRLLAVRHRAHLQRGGGEGERRRRDANCVERRPPAAVASCVVTGETRAPTTLARDAAYRIAGCANIRIIARASTRAPACDALTARRRNHFPRHCRGHRRSRLHRGGVLANLSVSRGVTTFAAAARLWRLFGSQRVQVLQRLYPPFLTLSPPRSVQLEILVLHPRALR